MAERHAGRAGDRQVLTYKNGCLMDRLAITYGEFYDFPRMVRFRLGDEWFFLRSEFDDDQDQYDDFYKVYRLPFRTEEGIKSHPNYWMELSDAEYLGRIPSLRSGLMSPGDRASTLRCSESGSPRDGRTRGS